eukprot:5044191-Prorocentrum_lima.AAC.1
MGTETAQAAGQVGQGRCHKLQGLPAPAATCFPPLERRWGQSGWERRRDAEGPGVAKMRGQGTLKQ